MDDKECLDIQKKWGVKMYSTITVWTKWQVVIPLEIRKTLNIKPWDTLMVVTKHNKAIWMVKMDDVEELMKYIKMEMAT